VGSQRACACGSRRTPLHSEPFNLAPHALPEMFKAAAVDFRTSIMVSEVNFQPAAGRSRPQIKVNAVCAFWSFDAQEPWRFEEEHLHPDLPRHSVPSPNASQSRASLRGPVHGGLPGNERAWRDRQIRASVRPLDFGGGNDGTRPRPGSGLEEKSFPAPGRAARFPPSFHAPRRIIAS
jgi:hypothetical protein